MSDQATARITCSVTGELVEAKPGKSGPKLPRGWKWLPSGEPISAEGLRQHYRHVAIQLTVVGIVDLATGARATNDCAKELWRSLRAEVRAAQDDVAIATNQAINELYGAEEKKLIRPGDNGKVKLPKMPKINVYQVVRDRAPNLSTRCAVSLQQRINSLYAKDRWELLRGKRALRSVKPERQPIPVHNQAVKLDYIAPEQHEPVVTLPIREGKWSLVLSVAQTGARRRGRVGLAKKRVAELIAGNGWIGEAMIYQRFQPGTNRDSTWRKSDLVVQIAAWVPREQTTDRQREGMLYARSVPDALLVCVDDNDERIWTLNGDNLRKKHMAHLRQLERLRDDRKREQRPHPTFEQRQKELVDKHRRYMRTKMHEYAAQLVSYAKRRRVAAIRLDLTDRSYAYGQVPWYDFSEKLKQKAEQAGIEVDTVDSAAASGEVASE